ncbi:MAG TPA: PVC-type heme-binding CxxCH protein [Acidobacteriota bacterium]
MQRPSTYPFILFLCFSISLTAVLLPQKSPQQTLAGLKTADGLEITLWASEPSMVNPTNIDVDARGRIWVLEAVNYRRTLFGKPDYRAKGDRILILEDTDGDGKADKTKVFAQDPSLRSPLGIAVLGNQVIVSQSPDLIIFTKDDQDNIVKKEVLLTGWRGIDHDHGVHAVVFGHDGRYYLNNGDQGFDITDRSGTRLVSSKSGPYFAGCALRVNPDGTGLTVLAHNFRNPYELALDSFGNIWQTDNDDDGNAWVRVNYVMEGGNFGYWGPGGRSWREDKGTHFHSENPGVVPNIKRTGAGAPCGLLVYEGRLLPEKHRGQLIHAEAGKRLINTYSLSRDGAGYAIDIENTVESQDTWFRPSDVCVGPDGAVYISDWYDPGVGGHQMVDISQGRIYRLAPAGFRSRNPVVDLKSSEGLAAALSSPAQSVRYLAYMEFKKRGPAAAGMLQSMLGSGDRILRARALWLLGGIPGEGEKKVLETLQDPDPDFRILATRILRACKENDANRLISSLAKDPSPQVRREVAIALQHAEPQMAVGPLIELCRRYDGKDRWYLEALGISARGKENLLYGRLRDLYPGKWDSTLARFIWEFRPSDAVPYLIASFQSPELSIAQRTEALDALAVMPDVEAGKAVAEFLNIEGNPPELSQHAFDVFSRQLFSLWIPLRKHPATAAVIKKALHTPELQARALELADDMEDTSYGPELIAIIQAASTADEVRITAIHALGKTRDPVYLPELERFSHTGPMPIRLAAIRAIGFSRPKDLETRFGRLIRSDAPNEIRTEAVKVLGRSEQGMTLLLNLEQNGQLPPELKRAASVVTNASRNPAIKSRAEKLLPLATTRGKTPLPPSWALFSRPADRERGRRVFLSATGPKCSSCHSIGGKRLVGPDLSVIGSKLGKDALLDSILNPSAGIAPEYYVWILETKTQGDVIGIIMEDTPQRVAVRTDANEILRFKPSEITSRRRSKLSLMPEDLVSTMTEQQLADLLEFLSSLKETKRPSEATVR